MNNIMMPPPGAPIRPNNNQLLEASTPVNQNIHHEMEVDSADASRIDCPRQTLNPRHLSELNVDDSAIVRNTEDELLPTIQVG